MRELPEYKKQTIEAYNKHATDYALKFQKLLDLHRREEFGRFIVLLRDGKDILDVGCGGGDHAQFFVDKGYRVTGIDISERMVNIAREKRIDACLMDLEELTFADESFDGIWAVTSLLHVPKTNMPHVMQQLHRTLRPEGILYACVKQGEGEGLFADDADPETKRFFAYYQPDEFKQIFEPKFDTLQFANPVLGKTTFLQYFFKKK